MDRQPQIKRLAGILFIAVLPLLNPAYGADKNTRQTSPDGDEGYFGGGSPGNTNAMILWPRDNHNIVRKYRPAGSAAGSPLAFKLWVDPGRSGGFPVNLKTAGAFCGFLQDIDNDPDKGACICEDDPRRPYTGAPLTACAGVNFPACNPVACTPGTTGPPEETEQSCTERDWTTGPWSGKEAAQICLGTTETQTRTVTKTDRRCIGGTPPEETRRVAGTKTTGECAPGGPCRQRDWSPRRSSVCAGEALTQTRAYCQNGRQRHESRRVTGTKYCPPPDPEPVTRPKCQWTTGTWTPGRNTACAGEPLTQTRNVRKITAYCEGGASPASSKSTTGTKSCPPTCRWRTGSWSPSPATTCSDQRVSQSRSVTKITANCVGGTKPAPTRTVPGAKRCSTCAPTSWSPGRDTVCAGSSFTQTRTLKNCRNDSRNARGTKCCGTVTGWSPSPASKCGSFTQTRTNACGKKESRSAKGTASWCGCSWGPYTPSPATVCKGKTFTQKSYYSCSGRTNKPRTRTASGTKSCPKTCSDGQSYCSAYTRYLCRNGKWKVIAQGPYACFTP